MKEPSAMEVLAAVRAVVSDATDKDPNWKSTAEWAKAWNLSHPQAGRLLREGRGKGIFRMEMMRRTLGLVGVRTVPCYRFVGKGKA